MKFALLLIVCLGAFLPQMVSAQDLSISFGDDGSISSRTIQLFVLVTILSLAPGLAIMITCFPFLVTVLSILRQAIGLQQSPPNMLIISLALFLTYFMAQLALIMRAVRSVGFLRRRRVSRGEFGVLE